MVRYSGSASSLARSRFFGVFVPARPPADDMADVAMHKVLGRGFVSGGEEVKE